MNSGSTFKEKYLAGEIEFEEIDDDGDEDTYKIVGSAEADAFNNLISNVSPLGQALMSHKEGDIVTVESPNGQYSVKILKVC